MFLFPSSSAKSKADIQVQLAGAAWTEQLILCRQDIAKLLTYTKAPNIVAVKGAETA